jgi:putative acetyltransferase
MEVTLRPARFHDGGAVAEIHLLARRESMPYLPDLHTDEETRAYFRGVIRASDEVVVAESEGRVVGFAALRAELLEHLYVLPRFQGRGVGSALLERAKELCPEGFRLWVFQRNEEARRFYERRGLRLVELTDGAGNEEQEPDALYEWRPA